MSKDLVLKKNTPYVALPIKVAYIIATNNVHKI